MKRTILISTGSLLIQGASIPSYAKVCQFITNRKACTGQEKEAFKPYHGQNPTTSTAAAESPEACLKKAEKFAKIVRKGVLAEKTVTPKFGGKDLGRSFTDIGVCKPPSSDKNSLTSQPDKN